MERNLQQWKILGFTSGVFSTSKKVCTTCGKTGCNKRCPECKVIYCSESCQRRAWPIHRYTCPTIDKLLTLFQSELLQSRYLGASSLYGSTGYQNFHEKETSFDEWLDFLRNSSFNISSVRLSRESEYNIRINDKETNISLSRPIEMSDETFNNLIHTGCRNSISNLLTFAWDPATDIIDSEVLSMLHCLDFMIRSSIPRDHVTIMILLDPLNTYDAKMRYQLNAVEASLDQVVRTNLRSPERAVIYCISFLSKNAGEKMEYDRTNPETQWKLATKVPVHSDHCLLLVRCQDKGFLVQSYYGHYRYMEWLDFANDLTKCTLPEPVMPNWFRQIRSRPRYRGLLSLNQISEASASISSLTTNGDHIDTYADLTGIVHDRDTIAKSYNVIFFRMDLDRLLS